MDRQSYRTCILIVEANSIEEIERGFKITRDLEEIRAKYENFVSEGTLKSASSKARGGITGPQMYTSGSKLNAHLWVSIMHAKIATLRWIRDSASHINAREAFPDNVPIRGTGKRRKTKEEKDAVELSDGILKINAKYGPFNNPLGQVDPTG